MRWRASSFGIDPWHHYSRYPGGTAVDFGTAHVIHRSVSLPAHRSYQANPAQRGNNHSNAKVTGRRNQESLIVVEACRSNLANV